jgi:predicted secreted protein
MEMLQESIEVERAQKELLEERVRASEEEWFVHDKMMSDIKQQLHEIRQVCHDAKESWKREVEQLRSTQQQQQ